MGPIGPMMTRTWTRISRAVIAEDDLSEMDSLVDQAGDRSLSPEARSEVSDLASRLIHSLAADDFAQVKDLAAKIQNLLAEH